MVIITSGLFGFFIGMYMAALVIESIKYFSSLKKSEFLTYKTKEG
jgi:hypothetical protein